MNDGLLQVDAVDFDKAAEALDKAGMSEVASKIVRNVLTRSANVVRENVRVGARRHGSLARGVHTTWKGAGLAFQVRVMSEGRAVHFITGGTKPHTIEGHAMPVGGVIGFSELVEHPGVRPDPYVHAGIIASIPDIQEIITVAAGQMAEALAKSMEV